METIKTATGRELECDMFSMIPTPPRCYISLPNVSFQDAVMIFGDSAETQLLRYGENVVEGFTTLQAISEASGSTMVTLKKE